MVRAYQKESLLQCHCRICHHQTLVILCTKINNYIKDKINVNRHTFLLPLSLNPSQSYFLSFPPSPSLPPSISPLSPKHASHTLEVKHTIHTGAHGKVVTIAVAIIAGPHVAVLSVHLITCGRHLKGEQEGGPTVAVTHRAIGVSCCYCDINAYGGLNDTGRVQTPVWII